MSRLRGVDGIRALAALSVLAHHVAVRTPNTVPGVLAAAVSQLWLGVIAFFVLSGFLLYRPFARATLNDRPRPPLRSYFASRALRILPAYWVALSVIVLLYYHSIFVVLTWGAIAGVVIVRRRRLLGTAILTAVAVVVVGLFVFSPDLFIGTTWSLFRQYVFLQDTTGEIIGPAWTLQVEAAFYLALPAIALLIEVLARRGSRSGSPATRMLLILGALFAAATVYQSLTATTFSLPILLPGYLALFAGGMLLAVLSETSIPAATRRFWLVGGLGLCALAVGIRDVGPTVLYQGGGFGPLYRSFMALGFALIIGYVVLPGRTPLLGRVVRVRILEAVGLVSYAIYLWHDPIVLGLQRHGLFTSSLPVNVATAAAVSTAVAVGSWLLVERRFLARKRRYATRPA